ncbi:MAG: amylosucrase [Ginsengibacter sp.]
MYDYKIHSEVTKLAVKHSLEKAGQDNPFYTRLIANAEAIHALFDEIYGQQEHSKKNFKQLLETIMDAYADRAKRLRKRDNYKYEKGQWFLSNKLAGMSLYVDRFCGNIAELENKIDYFEELGINVLHLMPLFESPAGESDGGYAVSNFRKIDERFGTVKDLKHLQKKMAKENMYLVIDIVLNHTSQQHEWAVKAKAGDKKYQDFFYMYDDRTIPDEFEKTMKEIFPTSAPGNFTWVPECNKWAMTVFHNYQWDLNYSNPQVFIAMLENIFFYANIGIDILRIDAPAFIWKQLGTTCTNLPQAHTLLQLIKLCVQVATPGMALLGEAIQAPRQIMTYFGKGSFTARECDFCYNATQMALQWDALATGDTKVMLAAQHVLLEKPPGTSWITYTRCHDDIGLGYEDAMIVEAGYDPFQHRRYLKNYYSGNFIGSPSMGALFSFNPKTGDARISGTLASLCGLQKALEENDGKKIELSVNKILMMQALSFFVGGLPMLFYGDEIGYTNDQEYLNEESQYYDNRWMHRPKIDWDKNKLRDEQGTAENRIFTGTKKLLRIRKKLSAIEDNSNLVWMKAHNIHIAGFIRSKKGQQIFCLFNFSNAPALLTWFAFKESGAVPEKLYDHWTKENYAVGNDNEYLMIEPYGFYIMETI